MTDLTTTRRPTSEPAAPTPTPAAVAQQPTLITEQQVMFNTAAAVAIPAKTHRWTDVFGSFATAVRRAAGPPEPVRHHHSGRYGFIENALMSREMDRL
jgi:hypothetical protein